MDGAVGAFGDRGYGATGVDHIVERAGTTRGAFYYYFASKADVARDLQEDLWGAAAQRSADAVKPEGDFLTNIRQGVEAYLAALKDLGPERPFLRQAFDDPALTMRDAEGKKWGAHFVREQILDAMDRGQIPRQDPEMATRLLVDALQALTLAALDGEDTTDALRVIDDLNEALKMGRPVGVGVTATQAVRNRG